MLNGRAVLGVDEFLLDLRTLGGPNSWIGILHGFTLDSHGVFTSFDPPGSTLTTPNFISPQGVIVGAYNDAGNVSHGSGWGTIHYG